MPLYDIQHITPLSDSQRDELASSITEIHSEKFTTPKMFVQVRFSDISSTPAYVGGKRKQGNHILANVRVGGNRTQKEFDQLCLDILNAWNSIVPVSGANGAGHGKGGEDDFSLRSCIILGGLTAGYEAGFLIPPAGGDVQWLQDHMEEFEMKAKAGDEEFQDLVEEVRERKLLEGASGKSAKQKLEEALGWGNAA